jgi:hypothetical protein
MVRTHEKSSALFVCSNHWGAYRLLLSPMMRKSPMARKIPPLELISQPAKPPPGETDGANGEQKRPAKSLSKEEVSRLVSELNAGLAGDDKATVVEAQRLCRALSLRAAERLGLIVVGLQAASVAQIVLSCVTIMKGAGVLGTGDAGITAEPVAE